MDIKNEAKLSNILLVGATCSKNNGSAAMVISTTKTLKKYIPNSNFTLLSIFPELDSKRASTYGLRVADGKTSIPKLLSYFARSLIWKVTGQNRVIGDGFLKEYFNSDIIIDLSGDSFSDDSTVLDSIVCCYRIVLCLLLDKPIVIYAQSIGPFKTFYTRSLSKFCLSKVDLLIARDEITVEYLKQIGVKNKIYFTADSAFLLDATSPEELIQIQLKENIDANERPIVGISTSQHIYDLTLKDGESPYITLMSQIVDYLVEKLNAQIILVPHVTNNERTVDDRFVGLKIVEITKYKNNVKTIKDEYSPEILKGLIGQCDMFIGARMHANIAATSMGVPTLAIAYSHKAHGIMRMLDLEEYVLDFRTMDFEGTKKLIDELWDNKNEVSTKLKLNTELLKQRALFNAELVRDLISSLDYELSK